MNSTTSLQNTKTKADQYYGFERNDVLGFIPKSCRRLLDIGCGAGNFGALVKRSIGAEVWGVEPYAKAAQEAESNLDRVVQSPFAESLDIPDGYFDVVTFNDSLEHFPDPYPPLRLAQKKLARGGHLICCIPNVRYYENVVHFLVDKDWEYQDSGILDNTHLRFFTEKSMLRTFDLAGCQVLEIVGINSHYWRGKKIGLLRLFFGRWMDDMRYKHFVVVAQPKSES